MRLARSTLYFSSKAMSRADRVCVECSSVINCSCDLVRGAALWLDISSTSFFGLHHGRPVGCRLCAALISQTSRGESGRISRRQQIAYGIIPFVPEPVLPRRLPEARSTVISNLKNLRRGARRNVVAGPNKGEPCIGMRQFAFEEEAAGAKFACIERGIRCGRRA